MAKSSRRRVRIFLGGAVLCLGGVAAYRYARGAAVPVVVPVRQDIVQTLVSSGRVMAPAEVTLSAPSVSTVSEVSVAEGDAVKAGQLLARLDDRELVAAVSRAQAAVARASAGALEVRRLSLPAARERKRQAETALEQARRTYQRDEELFRGGSIAPVTLEQSRAAFDVAESQLAAAALQLEATTSAGSASLVAAAALAEAKAELGSAEVALERSRIRSPLEGVVLQRHVDPGDSVQPGSHLFVVSGVGHTRLVVEPDERNIALLRVGQAALASTEAFPKERFAAKVGYIAPSVDARRGTIEVRLDVDAPPPYLKPDMTVSVEIELARKAGGLVVPTAAVHELSSGRPWVLVLEGGRALRRDVTTGVAGDGVVEVTGGVAEGTPVVAAASISLRAGDRARPEVK